MAKRPGTVAKLFGENPDKDIDDVVELMPQRSKGEVLMDVPLSLIDPDPVQPRNEFTEEELDGLHARIMATNGRITKPVDLKPHPTIDGRYLLEDGEMRWRVYETRMSSDTIPSRVITQSVPEHEKLLRQMMANIGGIDMTLVDIAQGIHDWQNMYEPAKTNKEAAAVFGWSQTKMTRTLKLVDAPAKVKELSHQVTNINTLDYMIRLYKADTPAFAGALAEFESDEFNQNAEKFWKGALKEVTAPESILNESTGQMSEQRSAQGAQVDSPDTDHTSATDETEQGSESKSQASDRKAGDDSEQRERNLSTDKAKAQLCPLKRTQVIDQDGVAVLQLFYAAGQKELQSDYRLDDPAVIDSLIEQLSALKA